MVAIKNTLRTPERWQHTMADLSVAGTNSGVADGPVYAYRFGAD